MEQLERVELGKRLAEIRGRRSQVEFANLLAVHKNTLARYETGERMPDTVFLSALAVLGVNIHWLITGLGARYAPVANIVQSGRVNELAGESYQQAIVPAVEYVRIAEFDLPGTGEAARAPSGALIFGRDWLWHALGVKAESLFLIRVLGDSMEPVLRPGDLVLVDNHEAGLTLHDGVHVMRIGDNLFIRRLQCLPGHRCRVLSANPAYPEFEIDLNQQDDDLELIGRVIWAGQRLS